MQRSLTPHASRQPARSIPEADGPDRLRRLASPRSALLLLALTALLAGAGSAQHVAGWGEQVFNSAWHQERFVEVAAGSGHTVARRSDGSVVAWGFNIRGQTNVPALPRGLTYAQIAAGTYHTVALVQSGSYVTFGPGCPGSLGVPTLTAASPPRVGQTMSVLLGNLPRSQAIVLFGVSNTTSSAGPLPVDLSILGLSGCWLRVRMDVTVPVSGASGSATLSVPVPTTPALVGAIFYQQAVVPDPQGGSAAGFVLSDAATAVIGS